ncbi:stage ii sporulation protein m, putative [Heliomicrobium modesticaldum Ice1]|uniref:Stage ii sporulation protein m, putative n=1 Tax=Heliobacterium modesticaldum (strain ATCC 51547 / Ice1) TaxID=498761 RepID=B0TEL0_HELMI|nr:stage II sporulation protein M [Heliomicrobium modesticaldum]ABZ82929.1 stage ii sporulation protein m, putative [Heliomicrobium modesticaldum Ice1]
MAILFRRSVTVGLGQGHLHAHWGFYALALTLIACGTVTGAVSAKHLPPGQAEELQSRILQAFQEIRGGVDHHALLQPAVAHNLETVGLILLLGLTVLGIPLIAAFLFFRGFVLGFAAGFLLLSRPEDGWFIILLALAPPSLVLLPALLLSGGMALAFSLWLVRRRPYRAVPLRRALFMYALVGAGTLVLGAGAGLIDAYITPGLLGLFLH